MDNKVRADLKTALTEYKRTFELTPPNMHRRNTAERSICTFRNHFLAGLATCSPDYPTIAWDYLIEQCIIKLNLLQNSQVNTNLSHVHRLTCTSDDKWTYHNAKIQHKDSEQLCQREL
eukprot:11406189-Ditylum_brightwellii.AAC.1